jgi:hypothetical protein
VAASRSILFQGYGNYGFIIPESPKKEVAELRKICNPSNALSYNESRIIKNLLN